MLGLTLSRALGHIYRAAVPEHLSYLSQQLSAIHYQSLLFPFNSPDSVSSLDPLRAQCCKLQPSLIMRLTFFASLLSIVVIAVTAAPDHDYHKPRPTWKTVSSTSTPATSKTSSSTISQTTPQTTSSTSVSSTTLTSMTSSCNDGVHYVPPLQIQH